MQLISYECRKALYYGDFDLSRNVLFFARLPCNLNAQDSSLLPSLKTLNVTAYYMCFDILCISAGKVY